MRMMTHDSKLGIQDYFRPSQSCSSMDKPQPYS